MLGWLLRRATLQGIAVHPLPRMYQSTFRDLGWDESAFVRLVRRAALPLATKRALIARSRTSRVKRLLGLHLALSYNRYFVCTTRSHRHVLSRAAYLEEMLRETGLREGDLPPLEPRFTL